MHIRIISRPWRHRAPAASWMWSWLYMRSKRCCTMASPPCVSLRQYLGESELPRRRPRARRAAGGYHRKSHTHASIHLRFRMRFESTIRAVSTDGADYLRQKAYSPHFLHGSYTHPGQGQYCNIRGIQKLCPVRSVVRGGCGRGIGAPHEQRQTVAGRRISGGARL